MFIETNEFRSRWVELGMTDKAFVKNLWGEECDE
jgi:hypothetical protein